MDHLTWPDAFAAVAIMGGFVAVMFLFLRASRGVPASSIGDILAHRERMAETRRRREVPDFSSSTTKTTTTTFEIPLTPDALAALLKVGALVKRDDGTYSVVVPAPESPKEPPGAVA